MEKEAIATIKAPAPNHPEENLSAESKCPVSNGARRHTVAGAPTNADWWPNQLNLRILHQHSPRPILWARSSIMRKNSRASTWMP